MNNEIIDSAISSVLIELKNGKNAPNWQDLPEKDLLFEFVTCILGSQVRYEVSLAASKLLKENGDYEIPTKCRSIESRIKSIQKILRKPINDPELNIKNVKYRFANSKAHYISRTLDNIYSKDKTLTYYLRECKTGKEARLTLIKIGVGIGPKQASMFLRDIGFSNDLAILDSHIMKYLEIKDLLENKKYAIGTLKYYEKYENIMKSESERFGCTLGNFDRALWIVMRNLKKENYK